MFHKHHSTPPVRHAILPDALQRPQDRLRTQSSSVLDNSCYATIQRVNAQ